MSELWRERTDYKQIDAESNLLGDIQDYLPYERLYTNLNPAQLRELIQDAKRLRWQALDLWRCKLDILPEELGDLPDLKVIDLSNSFRWDDETEGTKNSFIALSAFICNLASLQALYFSNTQIRVLPAFIGKLTNLQTLYLDGTRISALRDSFSNLTNLQTLNLDGTPISTLPDSFGNLTNLQRLYLGGTRISALPDSFANLTNLQELHFNNTQISALPAFIGKLTNLQTLYLDGTRISALPDSFGKLTNLQRLYLGGTRISALPHSFGNLTNLQTLDFRNTPLYKKLPPEIQDQSAQEIIRYILKIQSNAPKRYFNESKMVVVGQGSVGKSCLINRLLYDKFENQHTTEGIDIEHWTFSGKKAGQNNDEKYTLNVWDFGGQEIYHATHQFFLTRRTLYILVWDVLAEDDYGRRDYWMRTIQSFADDSPVIIVVNKCDKDVKRRREIEYAFLDRYPQIKKRVFYVSCRDDDEPDFTADHIADLRRYIFQEALKLPLMKTVWLDKWLFVRKKLETLSKTKKHIRYEQYLEICERQGIQEEEALSLIKYLHDLGIVLYYHEDDLLCGLVILSPQWGTDAVYKVLDKQQRVLKGRNGILFYKDLPKIWKDRKLYPKTLYPHLLKLMEKFQLAFKVKNPKLPNNTYLVAELLSENPMDHDWPLQGREPLAFRYAYDFLPAGVMTRLIVSINQYLETVNDVKQCWRKGAYLLHRSARAKVTLYDGIDSKYLDIRIMGDDPRDRRELLTVIRDHVNRINSRFNKIKITELVPCKCSLRCKYFFDYETLLNAERQKIRALRCYGNKSLPEVSVNTLLNGVEEMEKDQSSGERMMEGVFSRGGIVVAPQISPTISPAFNPQFTNTVTTDTRAAANASVTVTTEIRDCIAGMRRDMNELADEVGDDLKADCEKVSGALEKLDQCGTQEELRTSGAVNKVIRFLEKCRDPESRIGKIISGVEDAAEIVQGMAEKYNKIAGWVPGLPALPFGDS